MRTFKLSMISLIILAFISCGKKSAELPLDLMPVKFKKDGKVSLMKFNGEIVLADEFSNESDIFSSEGIIYEKNESGVHYYTIDDKKLQEIKLDKKYKDGTPFHDGYALVRDEDGLLSYIEKSGKETFNLATITEVNIVRAGLVSDGLAKVKSSDGLWGFINMDGKLVIKPEYVMVENFVNGKARVKKTDGTVCIIDQNNKVLFTGKSKYNYFPVNASEQLVFKDASVTNGYVGVQNLNNETILKDVKYKIIDNSKSKNLMIVKNESGLYGVIDEKGEYVGELRAKFEEAPVILKNGFAVAEEKKIKIFDKDGKATKQIEGYNAVISFDQEYLIGISSKNESLFQVLDIEGKELLQENMYMHINGSQIKSFVLNFVRNGPGSYENEVSLESTYFDFEKNFTTLFGSVTPKGIMQISEKSNIEQIYKIFNDLKSKQKTSTTKVRADRSMNYSYVFSSGDLTTSPQETAILVDTTSAISPAPGADVAEAPATPKIVDPYSYLTSYASSYSLNDVTVGELKVDLYAQYSDYIKKEIYGLIEDPIFKTSYDGITGYELNPMAQLRSIQISYTFDNSAMNKRFAEKLKEKLKTLGWKENGSTDLKHDGSTYTISLSGNTLRFNFMSN